MIDGCACGSETVTAGLLSMTISGTIGVTTAGATALTIRILLLTITGIVITAGTVTTILTVQELSF
jgi:hypothetical protein